MNIIPLKWQIAIGIGMGLQLDREGLRLDCESILYLEIAIEDCRFDLG